MRAVVFHGVGDLGVDEVSEPDIQQPTDAVVSLTASSICGTDLHALRGTMTGMKSGTILGHEGVGFVDKIGSGIRNLKVGDRVVIPSTIGCGYCSYCRSGYFSQCDNANPKGPKAGTAFYGGPEDTGPFDGLQAEKARIPYANAGLVKLPDEINDNQAVMLSDVFPTGFFGARLAEIEPGDTVAVFGCGPVGQFAIASSKLLGAGRIFAVDQIPSRLELAQAQGAEVINFNEDDPIQVINDLTGTVGVDRAIDAVGVEAERPHMGPGAQKVVEKEEEFKREVQEVAPHTHPKGEVWKPGDAPSQALLWEVESLAKAGTLSIIGVYPESARFFPIGAAMGKNLKINMGNCNHRKYIPMLIDIILSGSVDPEMVLTQVEPLSSAIEAYEAFDRRLPGWIKVELVPGQ
ncbi:MAG: glutathione-dependent formaldehyde dehydrogenase [Candidatus Methanoperedens sp.]|nr:glutathione-dependent formaldehyde dehydrogenase [Candidatus Methanoperedens sp.]